MRTVSFLARDFSLTMKHNLLAWSSLPGLDTVCAAEVNTTTCLFYKQLHSSWTCTVRPHISPYTTYSL
jgi:hypothetical protein